jgi:hypothetical protein
MKTIKLKTGVIITQDENGNIKSLSSPYHADEPPVKISALRHSVNQLKKL